MTGGDMSSHLNQPSTRQRIWRRLLTASALALLLAGCKAPVLTKLAESEANEALYTLLQGGVDAEKRNDGDAGFSLWAEQREMAAAIGLLKANAQPEIKHQNLGDLFGRSQLISTPTEERVRFVYGTEQGLAETLSKIDGVLMARVHIVLPQNDPLATTLKPSSASVFIKHRSEQDLSAAVPAIKDLVVRSIEGLAVDRVAVTLFAASAPAPLNGHTHAAALRGGSFLGLAVPAASVGGLWLRFGLSIAMAAAIVLLLRRAGDRPTRPASGTSSNGPRPSGSRGLRGTAEGGLA